MATATETESPPTPMRSRNGETVTVESETVKTSTKKKFVLPIVAVLGVLILFWAFRSGATVARISQRTMRR